MFTILDSNPQSQRKCKLFESSSVLTKCLKELLVCLFMPNLKYRLCYFAPGNTNEENKLVRHNYLQKSKSGGKTYLCGQTELCWVFHGYGTVRFTGIAVNLKYVIRSFFYVASIEYIQLTFQGRSALT